MFSKTVCIAQAVFYICRIDEKEDIGGSEPPGSDPVRVRISYPALSTSGGMEYTQH